MDYPDLAARTRVFRAGEPHSVTVSANGAHVAFLRSGGPEDPADRLWVFDVTTGLERRVGDSSAAGIDSYTTDAAGRIAAFVLGGTLMVADLVTGEYGPRPALGTVRDPRPDPTGQRIAYVTAGALHALDLASDEDTLLAVEADNQEVTWGLAELVGARGFGRVRGYWWSPDGSSVLAARVDETRVHRWYAPAVPPPRATARRDGRQATPIPAAGMPHPEVTLHLLHLDGGWVDVHWDRETYPYLVCVSWSEVGGPLITVLRRLQQHGLVLAVDPRTGETQVHAELADPRWVEPVAGTPAYLADGRVLIGGELAHDGYDARCLFADGGLLTPPSLYVRRVSDRLGLDLLIEASEGEPSEQHLYRVGTRSATAVEVQRLTAEPGWHVGHAGGETLVVGAASLDHPGTQWTVHSGGNTERLRSTAATPPYAPRPLLERMTDRRLPTGMLYPRNYVTGRRLPVLVDVNGGPGHQEVVAARAYWQERQWFADAGFAVVVVDNRGTPGVAPSFEKVIHRRLGDIILADQVDALHALADKHSDLDLVRVGIRGWSFGGWLAAMGVLRRPDVYRCGIAGSPIADWALYDAAFAERYLGHPADASDIYAHNCLLDLAAEPARRAHDLRPLLLLPKAADDAMAIHTERLSVALERAARPHAVVPLAPGGVREDLLYAELDFLRRHL